MCCPGCNWILLSQLFLRLLSCLLSASSWFECYAMTALAQEAYLLFGSHNNRFS